MYKILRNYICPLSRRLNFCRSQNVTVLLSTTHSKDLKSHSQVPTITYCVLGQVYRFIGGPLFLFYFDLSSEIDRNAPPSIPSGGYTGRCRGRGIETERTTNEEKEISGLYGLRRTSRRKRRSSSVPWVWTGYVALSVIRLHPSQVPF